MAPRRPSARRLQYGSLLMIGLALLIISLREENSEETKATKDNQTLNLKTMKKELFKDKALLQQHSHPEEEDQNEVEEREDKDESIPRIPTQRQQPPLEFVHIPMTTSGTTIAKLAAKHGIAWSVCHYATEIEKTQECPPHQQYVSYF